MLSPGTRIGPHRVTAWVSEGGTGQSYKSERTEGENKRQLFYLKLLPREISEKRGFEEFFIQECQALEQIEGPGIWPLRKFGVMKWKHWLCYDWFSGKGVKVEKDSEHNESQEDEFEYIYSLEDDLRSSSDNWTAEQLLALMISLHCSLFKAHGNGFLHGNLKPSNILILRPEGGQLQAWITEFGLYRLVSMGMEIDSDTSSLEKNVSNLNIQESRIRSSDFRPKNQEWGKDVDEKWDLYGMGKVVQEILQQMEPFDGIGDWENWSERATSKIPFESVAHSMDALPGVGEIGKYGVKIENGIEISSEEIERIRKKREEEWAFEEKIKNLCFRRNMTGFAGLVFVLIFIIKALYLSFLPAPWTDYSMDEALDSYQLSAGLWSGQAWGILPAAYDEKNRGGQNVVGGWEKEEGLYKLNFRKFKSPQETGEAKKLWQFIGKDATSEDDYHQWSDYLKYESSKDLLLLVKRVDEYFTYLPGVEKGKMPRLYPEDRFIASKGKILPAKIEFGREKSSSIDWVIFLGLGFTLASFLYHKNILKLRISGKIIP